MTKPKRCCALADLLATPGFLVPLAANIEFAAFTVWMLQRLPRGAALLLDREPAAWAFAALLILMLGLFLSLKDIAHGKVAAGVAGAVLSGTPFPLVCFILRVFTHYMEYK